MGIMIFIIVIYQQKMSFFRSDPISHYNLVIPRESAWDIMNKIGQVRLVHIVNNSAPILSKPFFPQVKRCEEALQKIDSLQNILVEKNICESNSHFSEEAFEEIYKVWESESGTNQRNPISMLELFQEKIHNSWGYYHDLNARIENLNKKLNHSRENLAIIQSGETKFGRSFFTNSQNRVDEIGHLFMKDITKMSFKTGIIDAVDELRFKRTVFRITKGNCLIECVHFDDIFQSLQETQKNKMVFFIIFPAQKDNYLDRKITKLVQTYCEESYDLPVKTQDFDPLIRTLQDSYHETEKLLTLTEGQMTQYLQVLAAPSKECSIFRAYEYLKLYVLKEKNLYESLNEMNLFNNFLSGEIYVRKEDVPELQKLLQMIEMNMKIPSGQIMASEAEKYPTHFVTNSYTSSAQEIVETYGTARYKEANPAFFTTVTFPFLFGVMFGDIAHGSILFALGIYLCFWKDSINNMVFKIILPHRYLLTMMGFFATYCGFIYNDFMSISLNLFGSCYNVIREDEDQPIERFSDECVYPIGLDPVWAVASNNLNYVNSLKMKISVIIAIVHMTLGVFVKAANAIHLRKPLDFIFEFLPQIAFMTSLFAYMDFLIVYKWLVDWVPTDDPSVYHGVVEAPSIITTMINIPLKLGKTGDCHGCYPLWGVPGDTTQNHIQLILLVVAAISVPLMLLPKPLIEICCHTPEPKMASRKSKEYSRLLSENVSEQIVQSSVVEDREHDASEIFVHQMIETIQYVLGCISNTASYLRLWALSLAHSQLSDVFLDKTVAGGIESGYSGIVMMVIGFPILAGATFGVLLCMDSMECFLHTLRLHWVEFQNKFYKGDGFPFVYYSFTDRVNTQIGKAAF